MTFRSCRWLFAGTLLLTLSFFSTEAVALAQEAKADQQAPQKLVDDSESTSDAASDAKPQDKEKAKADEAAAREAAFNELKEKRAREAARKRGEYSFDDLKFDIERGGKFEDAMLNDDLKGMHKKSMRIRGYILPDSVMQTSGIKRFVLVRDNKECCFGPGAMLYDCIVVEMEEGKTAEFATRPVTVKGTFLIDTESFKYPNDGGHYAVFKLKAIEVK